MTRSEGKNDFNLNALTAFNHGIVYAFDPEGSPHALLSNDISFVTHLIPHAQQYNDAYEAYLYAQDVVLPALRQDSEIPLTSEQFLSELNQLHARIAKTIMGYDELPAGTYTPGTILRWHHGNPLCYQLIEQERENRRMPTVEFIRRLASDYDIPEVDLASFVNLIYRLRKATISEFTSGHAPTTSFSVDLFGHLVRAYRNKTLTPAEKSLVDTMVKIGMPPEALPAAMMAYADTTLAALRACPPDNLNKVASFLADSFYQLTEIHPYPNGNGRLATCVMNIFLRYLGLPSILLRLPGEKGDKTSPYAKAIKRINETRKPLAALIKSRICDTMFGEFEDETLKTIATLRVCLSERVQILLKIQHDFDLDDLFNQGAMPELCDTEVDKIENDRVILQLTELLRLTEFHINELKTKKSVAALRGPIRGLASTPEFTPEQIERFLRAMNNYGKLSNWKFSNRASAFWTKSENKKEAQSLFNQLRKDRINNITIVQRGDKPGVWVIKCEDINFVKRLISQLSDSPLKSTEVGVMAAPC